MPKLHAGQKPKRRLAVRLAPQTFQALDRLNKQTGLNRSQIIELALIALDAGLTAAPGTATGPRIRTGGGAGTR